MLKKRFRCGSAWISCERRRAPVTSTLILTLVGMELSGQQSAGPWHRMGRGKPDRMPRGEGFRWQLRNVCSLFAMVSSDCHVRNAQARTTGLGLPPSETSLADGDLESPLVYWTPQSFVHSLLSPPESMPSVIRWTNLSQSITSLL